MGWPSVPGLSRLMGNCNKCSDVKKGALPDSARCDKPGWVSEAEQFGPPAGVGIVRQEIHRHLYDQHCDLRRSFEMTVLELNHTRQSAEDRIDALKKESDQARVEKIAM